MIPQLNNFFRKARILFVEDNCTYCAIWKSFIERINMQVKIDKGIRVIDVTKFERFDICENPLLKVFEKYIENYPTLFFDGMRIDGANSREEAEAYILSALRNDFIVKDNPILEQTNRFIFDRECQYVKKGLFRKKTLVCPEEE